jgi:hypothetical protein
MVESIGMAMPSKQDHNRSQVANSTRETQDCDPFRLEWLVIKLMRTLIWDWARKLRVGKWRILDEKVESGPV